MGLRRLAVWSAIALAALLALTGAALLALANSAAGSAWLLARVPGLSVQQPQGRLFGGPFAAERVELAAGARTLRVERLAWADARWGWRPHAGAWVSIALDGVRADRVDIGPGASSAPAAEPTSLRLPFALVVDGLLVGQVQLEGAMLARNLRARIEIGHERGSVHRIPHWSFETPRAAVQGQARIAADAPLALEAHARADSAAGASTRWRATLAAQGPLAAVDVQAQLTSADTQGARARAHATVAPFAAWPLSILNASLAELDLAALAEGAPRTRLSGRATIDTRGLDAPVTARVSIANAEPGRWDQRQLPVAALELDLAGRADERQRVAIRRFELQGLGSGGRASGRGEWHRDAVTLEIALDALRPAALDARAPAMTLGGTLWLRAAGLPAPDGSAAAPAAQTLQSTLALDGRLDAKEAPPVRLRGTLQAERAPAAWRVELEGLEVQAGAAQLRGQVRAQRERQGALRLATQGEARRFDPAAWWPAAPTSQLDGRWSIDLAAPPAFAGPLREPATWLGLRGQARVELGDDSRMAGVPLAATLVADGRQAGWTIDAQARAAGNRALVQGRLAPRAADDAWRAEVEAPALAELRPLVAALAPRAGLEALEGALTGGLDARGRWPALRGGGQLRAGRLRVGPWSAQRVALQGRAGPDRDAPLALALEGERVSDGRLVLETLRGSVDGSLASHRVALEITTPLRPPAWAHALLGAAAGSATTSRALLRTQGRWLPGAAATPWAGTWQAQALELDARALDASVPWLAAKELGVELQLDANARAQRAALAPGRASVLGAAVTLREARWLAGADAPAPAPARPGAQASVAPAGPGARPAAFTLDAELEPLRIAPWLVHWQPEAGFGGDLRVKAHAQVRRTVDAFAADIVLERADGDLAVTSDGDTQALGLTDLRFALAAQGGTWHFTQAVAGANLGVLAGAQSLRLGPAATWPAPDTPMQGVLEWQVADLGVWAPFTPPGWRVAGRLRTSAAIGGRFGAPEIEGRLEGAGLSVRNLLQGVDLREGELALSLRGADARVERFAFKGGEGELRLAGDAKLGARPRAQLTMQAERFRLLGRADRRVVASGEATLALDASSLALDGRLAIDEGLIDIARGDAPSLDADVTVRGGRFGARPPPEPAAEAGPAPAAPRDLKVAVALDLGSRLRLRGRGLDTRLAGKLAISAPGRRLAIRGDISALDGTYAAYGQKLEIERGALRFLGEPENPRLDILAVRPNLDVKVGVQISGTAQSPRVRLASEPEMSEYDKLSWLVLGRASDGLARADTALLQRAALALLAGEGDSPDAALLGQLGIDEFSVRQNDSGEVRETVVTLGKQLSRRWYLGYERSVNSTTGTWQLIYRAAQRFTLRAQSGAENSLDAIWTWRWN